jgi:Uri superfamily endonuclease
MEERAECTLAQTLARGLVFIPGFGCTDCKCCSHLYFGEEQSGLRVKIIEAFSELGVPYQIIDI